MVMILNLSEYYRVKSFLPIGNLVETYYFKKIIRTYIIR